MNFSIKKHIYNSACFLVFLISCPLVCPAEVQVDNNDPQFEALVLQELEKMREGSRGRVCRILIERLDGAPADTLIKPLTRDESTWHPNDRKGRRSHVVAQDTKIRGGARETPTQAVFFLHPSRINPNLSLFRLGTFVHQLSHAVDFNFGVFSGDYIIREKKASFFRNAWRDSSGYKLVEISDRIPTPEYLIAKDLNLMSPEHEDFFPILNPHVGEWAGESIHLDVSRYKNIDLIPRYAEIGDGYFGRFKEAQSFLIVVGVKDDYIEVRSGTKSAEETLVFNARLPLNLAGLQIKISEKGFDFDVFEAYTEQTDSDVNWEKEFIWE